MCVIIQNSNLITYPHISLVGKLASRYMMVNYHFFNHYFPEDKYDTLEYSWVKATMVSVCLRISLFVLTNTNHIKAQRVVIFASISILQPHRLSFNSKS